jgi:tRNA A-37 threonylcarbamoyl transferase component Bud32
MADVRYRKQEENGWNLRVRPDCTPEFVNLCCCDGKSAHPSFETIRNSRNTLLYRMVWNGRVFYHKEFKSPTRGRQLRKWYRAFQQIRVAGMLKRKELDCPEVFCAGRKGLRMFCVYEGIAADGNAPSVYRRITAGSETRISAEEFLYQFGRFTGTMHRRRVAHGDYQWGNVLVRFTDKGLKFVLIDNDRTSAFTGRIYWYRLRNLIQLMHAADYVPDGHWDAFWVGYMESYPKGLLWKPLIERAVRKRVAQRRRKSADRKGVRV